MRRFVLISPTLWNSKKFGQLKTNNAKLVYFYLHTNELVNSVGCYHLSEAHALADLKLSRAVYRAATDELVRVNLIEIDRTEETIFIVNFLRFSTPMNRSHLIGMFHELEKVPSEKLKAKRSNELKRFRTQCRHSVHTVSTHLIESNKRKKERKKAETPEIGELASASKRARSPTAKADRQTSPSALLRTMDEAAPPSLAINAGKLSAEELARAEAEAAAYIAQLRQH